MQPLWPAGVHIPSWMKAWWAGDVAVTLPGHGFFFDIPVHVLSRARIIFLFFVGFFSVLACFEHGDQKVLFGLFGFAQKL